MLVPVLYAVHIQTEVPTPVNCANIEIYVDNTFPSCKATTPAYTPFKQCLVSFTGSMVREDCSTDATTGTTAPANAEVPATTAPTTAGTAAAGTGGARSLYGATATSAAQRVHRAVQAAPQQQQQLSAGERAKRATQAKCGTELKACYKDTTCAKCGAKALVTAPSKSDLASCDALKAWANKWSAGGSCDLHSGALGDVVKCGMKAHTAQTGTDCSI
jgi:hypothetical protein